MTGTTYQTEATALPSAGIFPVPGAIGALAAVDVTVPDLPTAVSEDDVEGRLQAFPEKLRAPARASLLERLRKDGRLAMETFRDWMALDGEQPFAHQVRHAIEKRRRRAGPPMDGDGPGDLVCSENQE